MELRIRRASLTSFNNFWEVLDENGNMVYEVYEQRYSDYEYAPESMVLGVILGDNFKLYTKKIHATYFHKIIQVPKKTKIPQGVYVYDKLPEGFK